MFSRFSAHSFGARRRQGCRILRTTPSALRRAIREPDFPMPPVNLRPLRWTEGQIERLLWAPQTTLSTSRNATEAPEGEAIRALDGLTSDCA